MQGPEKMIHNGYFQELEYFPKKIILKKIDSLKPLQWKHTKSDRSLNTNNKAQVTKVMKSYKAKSFLQVCGYIKDHLI